MRIKSKKDAFPKKGLVTDLFSHQDIKQCSFKNLERLMDGKIIDVPDPKTSVGVKLTFLNKVEVLKKKGDK